MTEHEQDPGGAVQSRLSRLWSHPTTVGISIGAVALVLLVVLVLAVRLGASNPVPADIRHKVSFPVYYPEQSQLPAGYSLNQSSFRLANSQGEAVIYSVSYGNGQELIVSVQKNPSGAELAAFVKNYIPVHRELLTHSGKATIGAIGQQTVASLPTDSGAWVLITAPADAYGTDNLSQVLKALRK
jgi:hypothetical protein